MAAIERRIRFLPGEERQVVIGPSRDVKRCLERDQGNRWRSKESLGRQEESTLLLQLDPENGRLVPSKFDLVS